MIWIIGGTSEAAELINALQGKAEFIVSVATETGKEFLEDCHVEVGRMDVLTMKDFIRKNRIKTVIDASHPYATEVTDNAKRALEETDATYIRFTRPKESHQGAVIVDSFAECLQYLNGISGTVFFTTGSNQVKQFEAAKGKNRFVYRVLPTPESTEECRKAGIALKDVVAALGPFSIDLNKAMFRDVGAGYVIMKNSGKRGGTSEKIAACRQLGITPVIIERDDETGFTDLARLLAHILNPKNEPITTIHRND